LAKGEVERLFKCVVCPKAFGSKQSLRAHMKVHKGEGYRTTHVVVVDEEWDWFCGYAGRHNTTTCQLIRAFIKMAREGEKQGVITVGGPNPVIFQLQEVFLGKPRSSWEMKVELEAVRGLRRRCPECGSSDIHEFRPSGSPFLDGRCRKCGAEWLIKPSYQPEGGGRS